MCETENSLFPKCIIQKCTNHTKIEFWQAINIYISNLHVNRKLNGAVIQSVHCFHNVKNEFNFDCLKNINISNTNNLPDILNEIQSTNEITNLKSCSFEELQTLFKKDEAVKLKFLIEQKLLPRNSDKKVLYSLTFIDFELLSATFLPCEEIGLKDDVNIIPMFPYRIRFLENNLLLDGPLDNESTLKSSNWLKNVLFPKIFKWMEPSNNTPNVKSLSSINLEEYTKLYSNLKKKYGTEMVKIWPENTDPQKFVYEDISIATYLLLLWKDERQRLSLVKKQSFVDLGCGNGLLVYLLSSEGHSGSGVDLRKRGIWDLYPETTKLFVEAITPSNSSIFPKIDWIIGNHSDELSPWIPVIAARSSYNARYFVLPCCAFEFDGTKYQRKNGQKSQYNDFLDYVQEISEICGFETVIDRLKIPSTKRVCLIGQNRIYNESQFDDYSVKIQNFIDIRTGCLNKKDNWSENFKPRESIERVRNCTQIDKNITNEIIQIIFDALIAKKRYLPNFGNWNAGGKMTLPEIAQLIPKEKLKKLKSEFGGLQTLIKNNHQIFQTIDKVQLRRPIKLSEKILQNKDKNITYQQKECWFFQHHPNNCPLKAEDCSYKH